jgi:hypothetical protein
MDIFDILGIISQRKNDFMRSGMIEKDAFKRARLAVSKEYHIPPHDIRKICGI